MVFTPELGIVNVMQDAGADSATPETQPMAGFPRQEFQLICANRGQRSDAQSMQVAFIIKSARISEVARQPQLRRELNPVAVCKLRKGGARRFIFTVVRLFQIDAGTNSDRLRRPAFSCLHAFGFKVKALAWL